VATDKQTIIGYLGGRDARGAQFDSLERLFPPGMMLDTEPLNLWRDPPKDAQAGEDTYVDSAVALAKKHSWDAVALTGTPNEVLYPAARERIGAALGVPVTSALTASVAALHALEVGRVLLLTPFDEAMNESVTQLFAMSAIETVLPTHTFGSIDEAGALDDEGVAAYTQQAFDGTPGVEGVCFQGARLNPLPIMDRLEADLGVPVVASNPAMLWRLLSEMGQHHQLAKGGRLLRQWPAFA
jgi:Asp/Glu/hydantoin racemase